MSTDLETIRRQVREAQEDYARDVDQILAEMTAFAASVRLAIGELSYSEALDALRTVAVKAIDRCAERRFG